MCSFKPPGPRSRGGAECFRRADDGTLRLRLFIVLPLVLVLLAVGTTAVLAGSDMLQRFGIVLLGPAAMARLHQPTPVPAPGPNATWTVTESRAEPVNRPVSAVQAEVDIPLRMPTWLPAGVVFRGALANQDRQGAVVSYMAANDPAKGFGVQIRRRHDAGGYAVPATATQPVRVHGLPAVYAQGTWNQARQWQPDADAGVLSWDEHGLTFVVTHSGLHLTEQDAIRIAESLR